MAPAILPFRAEGVQRIINPLFAVYEHKVRGSRDMKSILYGLFYKREKRGMRLLVEVSFLLSIKRDSEGKGRLKFFWFFGIDQGGSSYSLYL
jgi:hypothetical protein